MKNNMKIKAEFNNKYPIWGIYNDEGEKIDFYDRKLKVLF